MTAFVAAYSIYPPFCHRFVGYLEEEAVHTYTDILRAIDRGQLDGWCHELAPQVIVCVRARVCAGVCVCARARAAVCGSDKVAPQIAVDYWHMKPGATVRDLMLVVRAGA